MKRIRAGEVCTPERAKKSLFKTYVDVTDPDPRKQAVKGKVKTNRMVRFEDELIEIYTRLGFLSDKQHDAAYIFLMEYVKWRIVKGTSVLDPKPCQLIIETNNISIGNLRDEEEKNKVIKSFNNVIATLSPLELNMLIDVGFHKINRCVNLNGKPYPNRMGLLRRALKNLVKFYNL